MRVCPAGFAGKGACACWFSRFSTSGSGRRPERNIGATIGKAANRRPVTGVLDMTRRIQIAGLILPLALSACLPTLQSLQQKEPVLTADSDHPQAQILACVSDKWIQLKGNTPVSIPRENGMLLTFGSTMPPISVETTPIATGTHVVMRLRKSPWSKDNRHRIEEVKACL